RSQQIATRGDEKPRERRGTAMRPRAWFVVCSLLALTFSSRMISAASAQVLPHGTVINVRTAEPISVDTAHVGMRLNGFIDTPVVVRGRTMLPSGSGATLEVTRIDRSRNSRGRNRIGFQLRAIEVDGQRFAVTTNNVEFRGRSEGNRSARSVVGGGAAGGLIGGLAGGGTGAALGATAGAVTGGAISGSSRRNLWVPAN